MSDSPSNRSPREQQLDAIIAEYYLAAEQGPPPPQSKVLAQYPEFSAELREFFADDGRLQTFGRSFTAHETRTLAAIGLQIRDYRILNKIGAGGMGTVYLALHMKLEKTVALKILKADRERDAQAIARFEREWKAVGKLAHPHIVNALDAGEEGGTYFLAMEYLDGCDLGYLLKTKGPLEVPYACELIRQAALGLQYAHDHHLVHRDVKPSNLMLSSTGHVKVLDLGLAQLQVQVDESHELTREGQMVGTWHYMAPEQLVPGRQVDSRSDIFSLGVTFYSFLVGTLPISRGQVAAQLPNIGTQRADVPPEVKELLHKMLAPSQDERIQTMAEVANVLQAYTTQDPINILANDAGRYARTSELPDSIDATQRFTKTAHDVEVVPPPLPVVPPPVALPATSLKDWLLRYWQHISLGAVAVAATLMLVVILNWPDAAQGPLPGLSTPPRQTMKPPAIEEGHLKLILDKANDVLPEVFAVRQGDQEESFLLNSGPNRLPTGTYRLIAKHQDWLLTPDEEIVVANGKTQSVTAKKLPHVAWLYPRLPDKAGDYLQGVGTLWLKGMPGEGLPGEGLPYELTLTMGEAGNAVDETGAQVTGNWLEVKVIQGNYTETGRLLVDTNEYRHTNRLLVKAGWLAGTSSDIKKWLKYLHNPQKNPPLHLAVKFDQNTDAIRDRAEQLKIKIPALRVSVQDALIMLFGADFYSSSETLRGVRPRLAKDAERQGARELLIGGPQGDLYCWLVKSPEAKEGDPSYSYHRHETVPFSVVKIETNVPQSFRADFTFTGYGPGRSPEPRPTAADLQACLDLKRDLVKFHESSLPLAEGAKAKYSLTVLRHGIEQMFDVSLRMADAKQAEKPERWLEIVVNQKTVDVNPKTAKADFKEQALLLVEDLRDKKGVLTVKSGWLKNQEEVFEFEPKGDREPIDLGLLKLGKRPTTSKLTVHDVLTLMFDADLKASQEIAGLRTKIAGFLADPEFEFVDIGLLNLTKVPGEVWQRAGAPGAPPVYRFERSRQLPFNFSKIDFNMGTVFKLVCKLAESTDENQQVPSLLSSTKQDLETASKITKSQIEAAAQDKNWREWRSATPGECWEWAEFGGEKNGTVLLKCKRDPAPDVTKSILEKNLRQEDRDWIAEGRYWNAPGVRDFPKRAKYVTRGPELVELRLKSGLKEWRYWIAFDKLSATDQKWIIDQEPRSK